LAVVAGMKKKNDHAEPTKSRTVKKGKEKECTFYIRQFDTRTRVCNSEW